MSRPTIAKIDLDAVRSNFALAQSLAPDSKTMPMVKANAYGHGAVEVARALADIAPAFGVACIEEAIKLREAGISNPILLLEGTFTADEVELASRHDFWLMVENQHQIDAIIEADLPTPIQAWLGIDTGMHRLGFQPDEAAEVLKRLTANNRNVAKNIVIASHFASAEDSDNSFTQHQQRLFDDTAEALSHIGEGLTLQFSLANSAAILMRPEAHRDWNRPGYMIYGCSPLEGDHKSSDLLKPAMTFESAVISVRTIKPGETVGYNNRWKATVEAKIATIAVGYGDGYPRTAPDGTPVLINGVRCPLAGRVSMDMITVDVTALDTVNVGDKVTLWSPELTPNEISQHSGSSGYELLTRMPDRVPRVYI